MNSSAMANRDSISSADYIDAVVEEAIAVDPKTLNQLSSSGTAAQQKRLQGAQNALTQAVQQAKDNGTLEQSGSAENQGGDQTEGK
jgi:hypothetical protein